MSRRFVVTTGGLLLSGSAVLMMGNSGGRAAAGHGSTGAPGEGNGSICGLCHFGGAFGPIVTLVEVEQGGQLMASYTPGQVYDVKVTVVENAGNPSGYGFQLASLDANNANAGTWQNLSANVKESAAQNVGGRKYLEHKGGASATGVFTAKWVAPPANTGTVDMYYNACVVNGNGAKTGDNGGLGSSISLLERGAGGLRLPYYEPFGGWGGFDTEEDPVSLLPGWVYGGDPTEPHAWFAEGGVAHQGVVYMVSPPLDFSDAYIDPNLSWIFYYDTEYGSRGSWVEWSDDGVSWTKVGSAGGGLGWYNSSSPQYGEMWSGDSGGWVYAEHALEGTAGLTNVQVRVAFTTEGATALDRVLVGELSVDFDVNDPGPGPETGTDSGSDDGYWDEWEATSTDGGSDSSSGWNEPAGDESWGEFSEDLGAM